MKHLYAIINGTSAKKPGVSQYVLAVAMVGATILLCIPLAKTEGYHIVSYILLFVVSLLALFLGTGPIVVASTLSALAWNFFFIPPHGTFHIDQADDLLIFGLFFLIAIINGVLTTKVRFQERLVREREGRTNALFHLTLELSKSGNPGDIVKTGIHELYSQFGVTPIIVLQDGKNNLLEASLTGLKTTEPERVKTIADWCFQNQQMAGAGTSHFSDNPSTFYPLKGNKQNPGVLLAQHVKPLSGDQFLLWEAFLGQISIALEREFLGEMAQRAKFLHESDRLYKTLFNSISHEFRIPVATIMGAADTLLNEPHSEVIRNELFNEIFKASVRLNRLIENLLNMSRLESGMLAIRLDWYDINDLINKVTKELKEELKGFQLEVVIQENMPLVKIDYGLMEQVLYNLLVNATQHAPDGSIIWLNIKYLDNLFSMEIVDEGAGFPDKELPMVFNKFYRINGRKTGGLGLGLSIVKGFVEAHKGSISIENRPGGGARFLIKIPTSNPDINIDIEKL